MAADQVPPPPKPGLSLYANLLEGDAPGTISGAPVSYGRPDETNPEQDEAAKKQQALAASLRFQPTKRPQLAAQKAKAKAIANRLAQQVSPAVPGQQIEVKTDPSTEAVPSQAVGPKTTAADWIATLSEDEDTNAYYASTRQKRKKRKKNKETVEVQQDWDAIYDPSRPNSYEEYKHSEEKIREVREWKDLLYRHRVSRNKSSDYDSDRSDYKPMNRQFAPPASMSFAPPPQFNDDDDGHRVDLDDDGDTQYIPPPPPNPSTITNVPSGEDAYLRRLRMSQPTTQQSPPPPPEVPPPPGQIARAPVRYNFPAAPAEIPASEAELEAKLEFENASSAGAEDGNEESAQPRSNRPGQAGFAERLMMKYGWTKGSGLGATGSGITNALYVKADKRKKKSDAEGGGFVTPATIGKVMGGKRSKEAEQNQVGKFGAMSEVIRLKDMLNGMDVSAELHRTDGNEGGLMQEIGEECGEKYGSVERVYIHTAQNRDAIVFVKFVSQLSALRAVNALEGRIFSGNTIKAQFWDTEKFDQGTYEDD